MFYIDKNKEVTLEYAKRYIDEFKTAQLSRLNKLDNYYKNKNEIIMSRRFEDSSKPNNKISHPLAEYITKTNTTMFLGSPLTYTSEDDLNEYSNILESNNEESINMELAVNCSKYGYAILLSYLKASDEKETVFKMCVLDNKSTIAILSNDIEPEVLYVIRFWEDTDIVNRKDDKYITIISKESTREYKNDVLHEEIINVLGDIPITLVKNNSEMTGDYEKVIPLIDAYDLLQSDSANESEYFNNSYFWLPIEPPRDEEEKNMVNNMKTARTIFSEVKPEFISRPILENEVQKQRIVQDIHKLSFTPDLSDENFANNVSGVAMKYKLIGVINNITNKQREFKKAILKRNELIFKHMSTKSMSVPQYVDVVFTINIPANDLEQAQVVNLLRGLVSDETLLSKLSFVQDTAYEIEQVKKQLAINTFLEDDADE